MKNGNSDSYSSITDNDKLKKQKHNTHKSRQVIIEAFLNSRRVSRPYSPDSWVKTAWHTEQGHILSEEVNCEVSG